LRKWLVKHKTAISVGFRAKNEFFLDFREVFCYNTGSESEVLKKQAKCVAALGVFLQGSFCAVFVAEGNDEESI